MEVFDLLCTVIIFGGLIMAFVKKNWLIFGIAFPAAVFVLGFGSRMYFYDALTASTFVLMVVLLVYNFILSRKLKELENGK